MTLNLTDEEWEEYFRLRDHAKSASEKADEYLTNLIINKRSEEYTNAMANEEARTPTKTTITYDDETYKIIPGGRRR